MPKDEIYIGEDFTLVGELLFEDGDTCHGLEEFDIQVGLSTTPLGSKLLFSTAEGAARRILTEGNRLKISVSSDLSAGLSEGPLIFSISLQHRRTGTVTMAEAAVFEMKEIKNKQIL